MAGMRHNEPAKEQSQTYKLQRLDQEGRMRHNEPAKEQSQTYKLQRDWIKKAGMRHNEPAKQQSQTYILQRDWIKKAEMRQKSNHRLTPCREIGSRRQG